MEAMQTTSSVCSLPLVGEGWGGGWRVWQQWCVNRTTPTPNPSPQGGGERTQCVALFCVDTNGNRIRYLR